MKKILSLCMALIMLLGMCGIASAETAAFNEAPYKIVELDQNDPAYWQTEWEAQVRKEIQKKAPVNLSATFTDKDGKVTVETTYMGAIGHTDAKLQVWVVEDSITAIQKMPDGSYNSQYIHRHVFRGAVNGDWGTDISIDEGEKKTDKFDVTIDDTWNRKQLSAVVFVYNDQGVLQVISKPLKQ